MPELPPPPVQPDDWIFIGHITGTNAVVCAVDGARVRVVYIDGKDMAIDEWVVWQGDRWAFEISGPCGGYADRNPLLGRFVARLRNGDRD